jgi:hypothetical protein
MEVRLPRVIGLQRRQVFRQLCGSSKPGPRACLPNAVAAPITIGSLLRYAPWHCRSCASDTPTLARPGAFAGAGVGGGEADGASWSLGVTRDLARWTIVEGLGQDSRHRLRSPHQPRRRRDCLGPPSAFVGLEQLPACTGPSHPTQASWINGVVRRVHGTLFADDDPNNHRPKATQLVPLQNCKTW